MNSVQMTSGQAQALFAFLVCIGLYACIIFRRKRMWHPDMFFIPAAFIAASEIQPFLQLCAYPFFPDPPGVSKLYHLEIFVGAGGLALLLCSVYTIVAMFAQVITSSASKTYRELADSEESIPPDP